MADGNTGTFNIHINARTITINQSEIQTLIVPIHAEGNVGDEPVVVGDVDVVGGPGEQNNEASNSEQPSAVDDFNPEEWTQLSNDLAMFKLRPVRPNTCAYRGIQVHAAGRMREVVVKLLRVTDNYERDVDFLLELDDHQNIVKVLQSGKIEEPVPQIFLAMERCLQNLNEYINDNPFDLKKAIVYFEQTVSALAFIHGKKIAHLDLKPSNILITFDGKNIKVSGFGISRKLTDGQIRVTNPCAGTEGFKAVELYRDEPEVGYKADIFSLGICGCIIMTHGHHPFGEDAYMWVYNIRNNKCDNISRHLRPFPEPLSPKRSQLIALLNCMVKPEPRDRPTGEQVLQDVFFEGDFASKSASDSGGIISKLMSFLRLRGTKQPPLEEKASNLMKSAKYRDATEILLQLYDSEDADRLITSLQIAECEIRLKSDDVQESLQRVRNSIPERYSVDEFEKMTQKFTQERHYIRSLILLHVTNEINQTRQLSSNEAAEWIGRIVYRATVAVRPLINPIFSDSESREIAFGYGLDFMFKLWEFLLELNDIDHDVKVINEARCRNNICSTLLGTGVPDCFDIAFDFARVGIECLEEHFGDSAKTCEFYCMLLYNFGVAYAGSGEISEAVRLMTRAIEAHESANYRSDEKKRETIKIFRTGLGRMEKFLMIADFLKIFF